MARHLCIVARENSPLYGYLTIAFRDRPAGTPALDIVLDRRLTDSRSGGGSAARPNGPSPDRRRRTAVDEAVRARGYAIFTGPGGGAPSRQDEAFIERAIGLLADVERRGPLALRFGARRRAVLGAILKSVATVLLIAVVLAAILRLGGIGRIADAAAEWTDSAVRRVEDAWVSLRGQPEPPAPRRDRDRGSEPEPPAPRPDRDSEPAPPVPAAASPTLPTERGTLAATPLPPPPPRVATSPVATAPPRAPTVEAPWPSPPPAAREPIGPAETQSLPAFTGRIPRLEMSRQAGPSGSDVVYSVRLVDPSGRVLSGAQVWLRGQSPNGQIHETRLDDSERAGIYTSGPLPPDLMPASGLSVRVVFSNMRIEIPVDG